MLKYQQLINDLKQGRILPLYLFFGEEEFLIQEALDLIVKKVVDPGTRDFNFNIVYCRETGASEIVNLAQTLPLMSERRLVIAKEIDAFKAADLEELVLYLKSPSPSTCLVMVANQRKYEKKSVVSAVEEHGAVVVFYPLDDKDVVTWIINQARMWGLSMQMDAAHYVFQMLGNDLQKISNELQKAKIYLKDKKEVAFDDVKAVVGDFRDYTVFDLVEAIGHKNKERAFLILSRLLLEGEQPVGLLAMLDKHFNKLGKAKGMEAAGIYYDEIKKTLKVFWRQSASFKKQMQSFTFSELSKAFEVMMSADRALKSSGLSSRLIMDRMILELCGIR